ncbi:hypothetical protein SDJN02_15932, partial [Cucurbita argyrosperma subsp. argyrosperma]
MDDVQASKRHIVPLVLYDRVDLGVIPHRLEEGKSANKDAGPRREGSPKGKVQRGQYLLVVGLGPYIKDAKSTIILSHKVSSAIATHSVMSSRMGPRVVRNTEISRTSLHPGSIEESVERGGTKARVITKSFNRESLLIFVVRFSSPIIVSNNGGMDVLKEIRLWVFDLIGIGALEVVDCGGNGDLVGGFR